jgi:transcriptional regulator with XRE-family HTH domain
LRIVFYGNSRGRLLALDWLQQQRWSDVYRYVCSAAALLELGTQGRELGPPVSRHLADGLYELRPLVPSREAQLLYFLHEDDAIVLGAAKRAREPLPLATLVRACRLRRAYERDPQGRSHDAASTAGDTDGLELLERLTGFDPKLREGIDEERLTLQVAQAASLFRARGRGIEDRLEFYAGLSRGTLAELERGEVRTQAVARLRRIARRLDLDVRLVLVPRPENGRRKHVADIARLR